MTDLYELIDNAQDNPDDWGARSQLAQAYKELGMPNEALTALRGNSLAPMTMAQSRLVKELRIELDPKGRIDMTVPRHPVSGEVMRKDDCEHAEAEPKVVGEAQGKRSIVLAGDVDPDAVKPHEKDSVAAQKASALAAALLVHVMIALLLGLVVISLPPITYSPFKVIPSIEEPDKPIDTSKILRLFRAPASNVPVSPTFTISSLIPSPVAIADFDETQNVDVTRGITFSDAGSFSGPLGSYEGKTGDISEVEFLDIRSSGSRMVFVIEASRYMLTDKKGGIPAYNKVKDQIARVLEGLNRQTAFNLVIYDGRKIATYRDELVEAAPSNVRQAIEWFAPINRNFENIGLREGYSSQPIKSGIEPMPVNDLVHYIKASQRALEMDANTIFLLSNGWGWHRKTMEPREYEKWMRRQKWGEKEEKEWAANVEKARDWLKKENEARLKMGIPRRVVTSLNEIVSEVLPGVRHKPGPSYTMEDVEDQMNNAVSAYYRSKGKPRPRFNVVWYIGEDEEPSAAIETHLKHQTRRNRGKLKVLKGMAGLKNVTGE